MTSDNWLWWHDGIIYQIYPRSFQDSNGDGIGDLPGITSRLEYLKELGIDAIWLSPIYPSPDVDFGYDVSDYTGIDPKFGSMADFDQLLQEAHNRGIRVVLDLVLNHTSDQHPWFIESRKSKENPYRDWYMWQPGRGRGKKPNNWQSVFGGSGWEFDPATGEYYYHMFCKEQPDLNWRNPKVRQAILDVFRFWLDKGVDGFRLDVFNVYFKNGDYLDNPTSFHPAALLYSFMGQRHEMDCDQPEMLPLLGEVRVILDAYPERYAIGETFNSTAQSAARYCGDRLVHAAFNFELLQCRWNPNSFLKVIQRWERNLKPDAWPNYVLSNHDVIRAATRLGQAEDDRRLKAAAALLLTMRGTPFLYYGEEIGMRELSLKRDQIQDPVGKRFWPLVKGRDGCRGPMQWDDSEQAGFGKAEPWLPVHPDYTARNVAAQQADPFSLFNFIKKLIQLRKEYPALREGMFQPLTFEPGAVLGYLRQTGKQTALVAINFSRRKIPLVLGSHLAMGTWKVLLSSAGDRRDGPDGTLLRLAPYEAVILVQR